LRQSLRDPASFETKTPFTESGRYLVNEIWRKTNSPEAYLIERELFVVQFQGLIVIHTADEVRIPSSGWCLSFPIASAPAANPEATATPDPVEEKVNPLRDKAKSTADMVEAEDEGVKL